jgi:hypothetical protein
MRGPTNSVIATNAISYSYYSFSFGKNYLLVLYVPTNVPVLVTLPIPIFSENAKSAYVARKNSRLLSKKQSIDWVERLLQTPLPEHRKYCIWRILAPYFINVKHLSFDDSYDKIYQWLDKCNQLKKLDFDSQR